MTTTIWRGVHIYDAGDRNVLVTDGIEPALRDLGIPSGRYFFIRYWRGGPHVRLRLRNEGVVSTSGFLAKFTAMINDYFSRRGPVCERKPSDEVAFQCLLARLEQERIDTPEIVPDKTVREEPYLPELGKYGGPEGVAISEELFCLSTPLAANVLRETRHDITLRTYTALGMMLDTLEYLGLSARQQIDFLSRFSRRWSAYATRKHLDSWPTRLSRDRRELGGVPLRSLGSAELDACRNRWGWAVSGTVTALARLPSSAFVPAAEEDPSNWSGGRMGLVLSDLFHTHHNRMGIDAPEEAYLALLGKRLLCVGR